MNQYVTGATIKRFRENRKMTQAKMAEILNVSDKAVSKWETGRGYPDITLIEPIAKALGISTIELFSGNSIINSNRSCNMLKSIIYVCPVCGNVIIGTGEAVISCCGISLPSLEAEETDGQHSIRMEKVEDEYYVTVDHEMTKEHYISFIAAVSDNGFNIVKMYPEGKADARFKINRVKALYCYCNRHGLFRMKCSNL